MAEKTRRAYGADLEQLGDWASRRGADARSSWGRATCAATPRCSRSAGCAKTTVARKLAAIRAFYRHLVERRELEAEPGRPGGQPEARRLPAARAQAGRGRRHARPHPGDARRSSCATGRMFELAYAAGLRAEELVNLDLDRPRPRRRGAAREGQGRARPASCPRASRPGARSSRYLDRGRTALASEGAASGAGAVRVEDRPAPLHVRRAPASAVWTRKAAPGPGGLPAHPAALVRHPSARGRGRSAGDPGAAGARQHLDDPDLHSGRVGATQDGRTHTRTPGPEGRERPLETNVKAIELKELWRRYKEERDQRARERLVLAYSPLVKYVAGRMSSGLPAHVEESDLISYGLLGLISAIERFDPGREIKFETFAITRIKGSIIDELRSLDWVPRSVRAKAREIERRQRQARARAAPRAHRRRDGGGARDDDRGLPGRRSRRSPTPRWSPSTSSGRCRTPRATRSRCSTRSRTRRPPTGARDGRHRDEGPPGRRDRAPARAGEARDRPLLLREPDPARDRRGAGRHRVARVAAAHEGRAAPEVRACSRTSSRAPANAGTGAGHGHDAARPRE